eukprot:TRINITY_DN423_c1_g3_i1.p2 TRINITY_DN423_c1_g3~~TRINITY_DN423_c1_g3_i1.p2  ORF type:complete len:376 (-),score=37.18 TRINITY_DN423_c1_g3_i1:4810-5937(-)
MSNLLPIHIYPDSFNCTASPQLKLLLSLHNAIATAITSLPEERLQLLHCYYNFALSWHRRVKSGVPPFVWRFDLAASLAAVLFARLRLQQHASELAPNSRSTSEPASEPASASAPGPTPEAESTSGPASETHSSEQSTLSQSAAVEAAVHRAIRNLIPSLCQDITQPWYDFAIRNGRVPTMVAMPSLPALDLSDPQISPHPRSYIHAVSDTWPDKRVSTICGTFLQVSPHASCRFVNEQIAGDLSHPEIPLSEHERHILSDDSSSVGWVTRYEQSDSTIVTLIEVDPVSTNELVVNEQARRSAYDLLRISEQRLDMFTSPQRTMLDRNTFRENWILSRLLSLDQSISPLELTALDIDVTDYIHVSGSGHERPRPT